MPLLPFGSPPYKSAIGKAITSGTSGSILFVDASSQLGQDNANLFWDDTNNRQGIGTASPSAPLHVIKASSLFSATGGTITTSGIYTIHTFTTSGNFITSGQNYNVATVVVAGGGGGNYCPGGAGGIVYDSVHAVTAQTYAVTVGASVARNVAGNNSVFDDITAIGGGVGNGGSGGSGGANSGLGTQTASGGEVGYGHNGGSGGAGNGTGGGGGAGAAGQNQTVNGTGGNGGVGIANPISGSTAGQLSGGIYYLGGGGGGNGYYVRGTGGLGGGGQGGAAGGGWTSGTANTGGGGGGDVWGTGGGGGSGVVVISYVTPTEAFTEEQRLGYDTSNYTKLSVSQYGSLNIEPIGTNPNITLTPSGTGKTILNGNVGAGTTSPTAIVHIKAGTTTASTAPLKFSSGSLMTAPEAGAVEFLTDAYYGTITTGAARKTFAFLESPTFTGTVVIPTPFTIGAVSLTATGTELNYVAGVTSAIQTQLDLKAPLASPTFTGTVTAPTIVSTAVVRLKGYTVATLPAGTQGDTAFCTDLTTPTYMATAVGGGAVVGKVFFDGTNWIT